MLPYGFWHILRFQTPVTPAKGQLTEVSWLLRCGFSHSFTGSVQEVVQWMCRRVTLTRGTRHAVAAVKPSQRGGFTGYRLCRRPLQNSMKHSKIRGGGGGGLPGRARRFGSLWQPVAACGGLWQPVAGDGLPLKE